MPDTVKAVYVRRSDHTVSLVGEPIPRADLHIDTALSGEARTSRSSRDSLLGEKGFINLSWKAEMNRGRGRPDDEFPVDMPDTICNLTVYGREDRTGGYSPELPLEYMAMDHLYVQPEARGMGYGQLMWDCYVALVAYIDGDAVGKVGDDEDGTTYEFVRSQGVPADDVQHVDSSAWLGTHRVTWRTDGLNIVDPAPVSVGREEVDA